MVFDVCCSMLRLKFVLCVMSMLVLVKVYS